MTNGHENGKKKERNVTSGQKFKETGIKYLKGIWRIRCMITRRIDPAEEFTNPNVNFDVLMKKISNRIITLEEDFNNVEDPVVKGFILQEIILLREKYFDYLKVDIDLQHLMLSNPDIYGGDKDDEEI